MAPVTSTIWILKWIRRLTYISADLIITIKIAYWIPSEFVFFDYTTHLPDAIWRSLRGQDLFPTRVSNSIYLRALTEKFISLPNFLICTDLSIRTRCQAPRGRRRQQCPTWSASCCPWWPYPARKVRTWCSRSRWRLQSYSSTRSWWGWEFV